ncbi:heme-binding protein [Desulfosporosinus sp. FKB]|uniref:heme-binding protein n=1 Tax=Desulfosporosinus sp. FKB TaxID=1969835 RepID=UPI000B49808C|nr:heme-binding protein [Desulfosporosinus sp. FKB]
MSKGNENLGILSLPNCMPIEGGIQLIYEDKVLGAIGVRGLASDEDGRVAQKGFESFKKLMLE